jgi:hypothetical protein
VWHTLRQFRLLTLGSYILHHECSFFFSLICHPRLGRIVKVNRWDSRFGRERPHILRHIGQNDWGWHVADIVIAASVQELYVFFFRHYNARISFDGKLVVQKFGRNKNCWYKKNPVQQIAGTFMSENSI